jgi:hypothetical protein
MKEVLNPHDERSFQIASLVIASSFVIVLKLDFSAVI